mmetsp:Transcript_21060/g.34848  ORF Transcript_21060/g.34848 Transcript_21060/m.34848 type:complete len:388 (-) Transcript_21060:1295-2458(-)
MIRSFHALVPRVQVSEQVLKCFSTSSTSNRISPSLKKMMKPFFLKCHPDVHTTDTSKQVNMEALQNINGFMDTLDATCEGKVVDWPTMLPIEFLLKTDEITGRKKKKEEIITRRKVELVVPPVSLRNLIVSSKGNDRKQSIQRLQNEVKREMAKLLQVAGLAVPRDVDDIMNEDEYWDGVLENEILEEDRSAGGVGRRFTTDERPKSKREKARDRFVRSLDREKFDKMYNAAVKDMEADSATSGFIKNHAILRQDLVNSVIAKVRIDKEAEIEMLDELITLRRLSLIMEDNFDKLQMEEFGRMWEDLTIILANPRDFGTSETAMRKRRKRGQESGFRFTYCADNKVTIHVPLDFRDEELLAELDRNLSDWFNMVDESVEQLFRYNNP